MLRRPWPLKFLALFQFFSPVFSLVISAWSQKIPFFKFALATLQSGQPVMLFKLFGFPLIAGLSILAVKRWSYPVFLFVMGWTFVDNILIWKQYQQAFNLFTLVGADLLNIAAVSYFLIPAVRFTYFDPKVRWWEAKPRYKVNFWGRLDRSMGSCSCRISDISVGGLFFEVANQTDIKIDEPVLIRFSFFNLDATIQGRILHKFSKGTMQGVGLKFEGLSAKDYKIIRNLIKSLDLLAFEQRQSKDDWKTDLRNWFRTAVKTGDGFIPKLPQKRVAIVSNPAGTSTTIASSVDEDKKAA